MKPAIQLLCRDANTMVVYVAFVIEKWVHALSKNNGCKSKNKIYNLRTYLLISSEE